MINTDWIRTMARYNAWQNASLYAAADTLDEDARQADRGAFFGSIHGTLAHILWADTVWMARLSDWEAPDGGLSDSPSYGGRWPDLAGARHAADDRLAAWSDTLRLADIGGDLAWFSGALGADVARSRPLCIAHMFNHQTHHRGQVHAMLTAAGARPGATDLFAMTGL